MFLHRRIQNKLLNNWHNGFKVINKIVLDAFIHLQEKWKSEQTNTMYSENLEQKWGCRLLSDHLHVEFLILLTLNKVDYQWLFLPTLIKEYHSLSDNSTLYINHDHSIDLKSKSEVFGHMIFAFATYLKPCPVDYHMLNKVSNYLLYSLENVFYTSKYEFFWNVQVYLLNIFSKSNDENSIVYTWVFRDIIA